MTGNQLSLLSQISDPLVFIGKLGTSFAISGMFGCKTEQQGHVLAMHCVMEGQSPLTIMQTYHFIEGKLSMRADAMLGRFNAAGGKHKIISRTSELAEVELTKGEQTERFSLSWSDAQKEPFTKGKDGGVKDNYATPLKRKQMLWARVVSDGVRAMDPAIVCGAYTPEELEDEPALPPGVVDGEVVPASAPAPAATQSTEPAKKTRKTTTKEPAESVAPTQAAPVQTTADPVVETSATPVASDSSASQSIAKVVETAVTPAPAATTPTPATTATTAQLPQEVIDIVQLRDYVGPRWPADSKNGDWSKLWPAVKTSLKMDLTVTDEEAIVKLAPALRSKLLQWLNAQRIVVDKLAGSTDLNTWANQNPTTSATQS